jgi:hypothetical protein
MRYYLMHKETTTGLHPAVAELTLVYSAIGTSAEKVAEFESIDGRSLPLAQHPGYVIRSTPMPCRSPTCKMLALGHPT